MTPSDTDRYEVRTETYPMYDTLDYYGNPLPPNPEIIRYFDKTTGKEISAREYRIGTGTATPTDRLTQQILGQGFSDKWSGEGFGSADANAEAMASRLASIGITDINQFGKVDKYETVEITGYTLNGQFVQNPRPGVFYVEDRYDDPEGGSYTLRRDLTPAEAKQVQPSYGIFAGYDPEGYGPMYNPVDPSAVTTRDGKTVALTGQGFGNKATGQVLNPEYDFAGGNIWGGTFAGSGRTSYGVQFRPDGTPVFYTQYGGSSNTLAQIMNDLGPLAQIGIAIATGGLSIPQQIAAQAAISIASGADLSDVAKSVAVGAVLQGIPGSDIIKEGASFLNSVDPSGVLSNSVVSATASAAKAVLTGQDVADAIVSGAIGGATAGAVDALTGSIPGFSDLSKTEQAAVKNVISGVASGDPLEQTLINTAISAGKNAILSGAAQKPSEGGITNRVVDEAIPQGDITEVLADSGLVSDDRELAGLELPTDAGLAGDLTAGLIVPPSDSEVVVPGMDDLQKLIAGVNGQPGTQTARSNYAGEFAGLVYDPNYVASDGSVGTYRPIETSTEGTGGLGTSTEPSEPSLGEADYVVQPEDYSDTTEEVQDWQNVDASPVLPPAGEPDVDLGLPLDLLPGVSTESQPEDTAPDFFNPPTSEPPAPEPTIDEIIDELTPGGSSETTSPDENPESPSDSPFDLTPGQDDEFELRPEDVFAPEQEQGTETETEPEPEAETETETETDAEPEPEPETETGTGGTSPTVRPPTVQPPTVRPPVVRPPVVRPPAMTPLQMAQIFGAPVSSPFAKDMFEALYGTMEYVDPFEGDPFAPTKMRQAATQKQLQQTKMAQGGYLDDLLAENISVDDLLKLLR